MPPSTSRCRVRMVFTIGSHSSGVSGVLSFFMLAAILPSCVMSAMMSAIRGSLFLIPAAAR